MSLIQEYRSTEEAIKELQQRLQSLSADDRLKKELEFDQKLRALMSEYNKTAHDVFTLLDPSLAKKSAKTAGENTRAPRKVKVYKNPHTGETVESKGGNNGTLKAWKAKWGADAIKSWIQ